MLNLRNFILFVYNYRPNFIEEIWGNEPMMVMHLKGKWEGYKKYNEDPVALMTKFLSELSSDKQIEVEQHIKNNPNRYA